MAAIEQKRMEIEAGTADIKRREELLPPAWEWVWMEDPWTGTWERLRLTKEEADYRRRREIPRDCLTGDKRKPESGGEG